MPEDELGSLSQKARQTSLRSARIIMIVIGVLTVAANLFLGLMAEKMVDQEISGLRAKGMVFDEAELKSLRESAIRSTQLTSFLFVGVGLVFFALAAFVYKAPVPCTVTALVLFIGGWVASVAIAVADGEAQDAGKAMMQGIIVKIFIIIGLVKAIQAAIAYQKERSAQTRDEFADDRGGLDPL